MSLESGLLKYIIKTPLTFVGFASMYVYGGLILTFVITAKYMLSGNFIDAFLEYFVYSALPPSSFDHIILQVIAGTVVAGMKWYFAMSSLRYGR
jgi:hypothetical protein